MVVSLVYCGEGWLWFVVSLYFMCACVSFVELDLFVLIDSVFGIACFSQFFSFMVYHLFEVVFISFGGSVSILNQSNQSINQSINQSVIHSFVSNAGGRWEYYLKSYKRTVLSRK